MTMTNGLGNADTDNRNERGADGAGGGGVADRVLRECSASGHRNGNGGAVAGGVIKLHPVKLPSAPASDTAVLLSMLERAAADPTHSIERMERMFALYEQAAARSARSAFIEALMAAKADLPRIIKTGAASYKDKGTNKDVEAFRYARWEEVCQQIEPVLAHHGLVLTFTTEQPAADRVSITGVLSHRDGHSERAQMALGCDASGGKNNAQGWGSAIAYGKRYTSFALLNLVGHDDKDTDAASPPADTTKQLADLKALIADVKADQGKICAHFSVETLDDLTAKQISEVMTGLRARQRKGAAQ